MRRGSPRRRIALTGGIATGKSTVASLLAGHGALVIDYDQLSREVVAPGTTGLARVAERFGSRVLSADGSLDRAALARVVFADPHGRRDLERIIHPLVIARADELEDAAGAEQLVIHDVPLLLEAGMDADFDVVVVTDLDPEDQVRRAVERDGARAEAVRARMAAQVGRARRLERADLVVDTSGPLDALPAKVDALWARLTAA